MNSLTNKQLWETHLNYLQQCQCPSPSSHSLSQQEEEEEDEQSSLSQKRINDHPFLVDFNQKEFLIGVKQAFERISESLSSKNFQEFVQR